MAKKRDDDWNELRVAKLESLDLRSGNRRELKDLTSQGKPCDGHHWDERRFLVKHTWMRQMWKEWMGFWRVDVPSFHLLRRVGVPVCGITS